MKIKILMTSFFFLFLLHGNAARGQSNEEILKKRFLSEYPTALKAWETRFSGAEGVVRLTEDDPARKDKPHRVVVYSFKCKLPDMASVMETSDREGPTEQRVLGYNKKYSFALRKMGGRREFFIESLEAQGPNHPPINLPLDVYLRSPYGTPLSSMLKVVTLPRFSVRAVSPVSRDGKSLLRIAFDAPTEPPTKPRQGWVYTGGAEGSLLVSPEEKWALYEYEFQTKKGKLIFHKGTVEYQGTLDGFPIPRRATHQSTMKDTKGDVVRTKAYDFLEFRFANLPEEQFTLAAFGVPEEVSRPSPSRVARKGTIGYWFLALALAALAAAVVFKVASSRLKGPRTT